MMEGLWQRPLGGSVEEREMGFGPTKLSLTRGGFLFCLLFLNSSYLAKQIWYCSPERR